MRVNPTVSTVSRVAVQDFTFQGLRIPEGAHLWMFIGAAHREPATFGEAQLGFGGGAHYCLGAWLTRLEMREALPILASRLGAPTVTGPVSWRPHLGIHGPLSLPLRFGTS